MSGIWKSFFWVLLLLIKFCPETECQAIAISLRDCQPDTCAMFCCINGYCAKYFKKYCVGDVCHCVNDCQAGSGLKEVNG